MKLITEYDNGAMKFEYEGSLITIDGKGIIGWTDSWEKINAWVKAGLVREDWYPHSMHHTDCVWIGPVPAVSGKAA